MTMRLVPEFLLFCLALRHPQLPEDAEALRRAIMADLDWNCIIAGARRHRLASHVLAGLASVRHRLDSRPRHHAIGIDQKIDVAGAAREGATAKPRRQRYSLERECANIGASKGAHEPTNLLNLGKVAHRRGDRLLVRCRTITSHGEQPAGLREPLHPAQSPGQFAAYRQAIKEVG